MTKKKIAFIDIDGTIKNRSMPELMLRKMEEENCAFYGDAEVFESQRKRLLQLRRKYKSARSDDAFSAYSEFLTNFLMLRLRKYSGNEVRQIAKETLEDSNFEDYVFSEAMLAVLREEHYEVVAISGSPQFLVDEFVARYGLLHGIGQGFAINPETLIYEPTGPMTYTDKHLLARKYLKEKHGSDNFADFEIVVAGDTAGDFSLMLHADVAFAINPNSSLLVSIFRSVPECDNVFVVNTRKTSANISRISFENDFELPIGDEILMANSRILRNVAACKRAISEILDEENQQAEKYIRAMEMTWSLFPSKI